MADLFEYTDGDGCTVSVYETVGFDGVVIDAWRSGQKKSRRVAVALPRAEEQRLATTLNRHAYRGSGDLEPPTPLADETVPDSERLARLAHVVETFRSVPPGAYIAAYATEDGGVNGVTYGDIAALVRLCTTATPVGGSTPDPTTMPQEWADLLEGLTLLAKHPVPNTGPLNCQHDELHVMADDEAFTDEEIDHLEKLGFLRDQREGGFTSSKFGSA